MSTLNVEHQETEYSYGLEHPLFVHCFVCVIRTFYYYSSLLVNLGPFQLIGTISTTVLLMDSFTVLPHVSWTGGDQTWLPCSFMPVPATSRGMFCAYMQPEGLHYASNIIWGVQLNNYWKNLLVTISSARGHSKPLLIIDRLDSVPIEHIFVPTSSCTFT